jgi:hypothetical protein
VFLRKKVDIRLVKLLLLDMLHHQVAQLTHLLASLAIHPKDHHLLEDILPHRVTEHPPNLGMVSSLPLWLHSQ